MRSDKEESVSEMVSVAVGGMMSRSRQGGSLRKKYARFMILRTWKRHVECASDALARNSTSSTGADDAEEPRH